MVTMFVSLFVIVLSFNFFMLSFQVNGVNRLVLGAPVALYETAIYMFEIDEDKGPTFDKEILEDNLTSYFDYSMPSFTNDYALTFYYYNQDDYSICLDDEPTAVEVKIEATLVLNYHYERTMYYEIRSM